MLRPRLERWHRWRQLPSPFRVGSVCCQLKFRIDASNRRDTTGCNPFTFTIDITAV